MFDMLFEILFLLVDLGLDHKDIGVVSHTPHRTRNNAQNKGYFVQAICITWRHVILEELLGFPVRGNPINLMYAIFGFYPHIE